MIALPTPSPPLFPNWGWSLESADGPYPSLYHQQNNYFSTCSTTDYDHETTQTTRFALADSYDHLSTSHDHLQFGRARPDDRVMGIKKLHHNASERDRRKKMNTLYSHLRSLLPVSDQMKKMSIPSTVARVVKYIPELQQQVQQLITRKEKLLSEIGVHTNDDIRIHPTKETDDNVASPLISLNRLGNGELVIQIPAEKGQDCPLMSEILLNFKEEELLLLNASSFQSLGSTMLFYNLHFQVKEDLKVNCEDLNKKIISLLKRNGDGVS